MAIHQVSWLHALPPECRRGAITIGNFDGVHLGHAALIRELVDAARKLQGPAVAVTFDPHPRALLRPELPTELLTTLQDRADDLHELGTDQVVVLQSTPELFQLRAVAFFERVVRENLEARAMVEGANFCFGSQREGDITQLHALCDGAGIPLTVVSPVSIDEGEVSSSRIRSELERGEILRANRMLGRPYRIRGQVGTGQRRGRTIGFPTANLEQIPTVIPAEGVYAVSVELPSGASFPGAANIGPNPTFAETTRKVEIHLIGYEGDLYGQTLVVRFLERLRETRRFSGVEQLIDQLRQDVAAARQIVAHYPTQRPGGRS